MTPEHEFKLLKEYNFSLRYTIIIKEYLVTSTKQKGKYNTIQYIYLIL